ncbi:hypothetical protein F4677DRAFT_443882 [Hypoxylon crocopeplum]|nr:hypothetical protein F4677DRAFT_443882 [Hypoxylon crocopeplum]
MVRRRRPHNVFDVLKFGDMPPGKGWSLNDPKIFWVHRIVHESPRVVRRCQEIVAEEAIKLGYRYAWMRAVNHSGKSALSPTGVPILLPAQPHITVAFGPEEAKIIWEGHIWVKEMADKTRAPQRLLYPHEVEEQGGNPKLWASGPYPYGDIPEDYPYTFKLGPRHKLVAHKRSPPEFYSESRLVVRKQ